jgi:DNA relaxase NicK
MGSIRKIFDGVFFDWYQGTLRCGGVSEDGAVLSGDADAFAKDVINAFKGMGYPDLKETPPRVPQYSYGLDYSLNGQSVVHLCYGGNGGGIHFISTGANAHTFYEWLRSSPYFGAYSITRADVRTDLVDSSAWEYLRKLGLKVAKDHKVSTDTVGDWIEGKRGRTLYLGAKTSYARVRIYEKGIKEGADKNWVRLEAQIRPPKLSDKIGAMGLDAAGMLCTCPWVHELFKRAFNEKGDLGESKKVCHVWTADKQTLQYKSKSLVKQYGKTLEALSDALGGWDMLGSYLGALKEDLERSGSPSAGFSSDDHYDKQLQALKIKVSSS